MLIHKKRLCQTVFLLNCKS